MPQHVLREHHSHGKRAATQGFCENDDGPVILVTAYCDVRHRQTRPVPTEWNSSKVARKQHQMQTVAFRADTVWTK